LKPLLVVKRGRSFISQLSDDPLSGQVEKSSQFVHEAIK
jgi:hypothetical protein